MSIFYKYVFPAANTSDVCSLQTVEAGVNSNLILNGNLANQILSEVSFISRGYSRNISITGGDDFSAVDFTITGIQNGVVVTEIMNGPNNNTVYSVGIYDIIISITTNADVEVSVGTGLAGFFRIISSNDIGGLPVSSWALSLTLSNEGANEITWNAYTTLDYIYGLLYQDMINRKIVLTASNGDQVTSQQVQQIAYFTNLFVKITCTDAAHFAAFIFVQQ